MCELGPLMKIEEIEASLTIPLEWLERTVVGDSVASESNSWEMAELSPIRELAYA